MNNYKGYIFKTIVSLLYFSLIGFVVYFLKSIFPLFMVALLPSILENMDCIYEDDEL